MKKITFFVIFITPVFFSANAQVTSNSGSGLSPTYTTSADAVTALNSATINAVKQIPLRNLKI